MMSKDLMNQKYDIYQSMSMEELQELVRQDIQGNSLDSESLTIILDVLKEKNKTECQFEMPGVDESWARFQQRLETVPVTTKKSSYPIKKWTRVVVAAAAMVVVIFLGTVTASAFGVNPITHIAKWTDDYFTYIFIRDESVNSVPYRDLPELIEQCGITSPVLPTWVPDGYVYKKFCDNSHWGYLSVDFFHEDTDEILGLSLSKLNPGAVYVAEKDDGELAIHTINGIEHYLMTNYDEEKAIWQTDGFVCTLSGYISRDELIRIIDSIY